MIAAQAFVEVAKEHGFALWSGVPCSYLQPFINFVIDDPSVRYVAASNEGDAVAIAAGAELGGARGIVMFQNSGLGNAVNPLTSLTFTHKIPMLLIVTLRGEPGGLADEPQHELMGSITTGLLDLIAVRWEYFPEDDAAVAPCLDRARAYMDVHGLPYCLVMRKGAVAAWPAPAAPQPKDLPATAGRGEGEWPLGAASRREFLAAIQARSGPRDVIVATTGFTGRELYALDDRPNQLYLVGAMGCAMSVGLGLALTRPDLRVTVLDGDGAALMRPGGLAAIGFERPVNLLHIVFDNRMHESTGGQPTVTHSVDLAGIAAACGYPQVHDIDTPKALAEIFAAPREHLVFVRAAIAAGVPAGLPRPKVAPVETTQRLRGYLRQIGAAL